MAENRSDTALSTQFIEQQRKRLEALRTELLGGEKAALAKARSFREGHADEAREREEDAQDLARQEVDQALHDVDKRRLADIDRALEKIAQGTYGISDVSGKTIPRARLETTPEALHSVDEEQRG
jgi:DnaK suppressor protein